MSSAKCLLPNVYCEMSTVNRKLSFVYRLGLSLPGPNPGSPGVEDLAYPDPVWHRILAGVKFWTEVAQLRVRYKFNIVLIG